MFKSAGSKNHTRMVLREQSPEIFGAWTLQFLAGLMTFFLGPQQYVKY